jgi:hypothetical protein
VDASGSLASLNLASAISNEADSGQGVIHDFLAGTASFSESLRAPHLGSGKGRIYELNYWGLDSSGNLVSCTATVSVLHDQSQ